MSRPSTHTNLKLIQAAREMLPETGCRSLNLRQVAARAGVNLGMFHYHFKSKNQFIREVVQTIYQDFLKDFQSATAVETEPDPLRRLEMALQTIGRFGRGNRKLLLVLLVDALEGNKEVVQFVRNLFRPHIDILLRLLKECQDRGLVGKDPVVMLAFQCLMMMNAPIFLLAVLERTQTESFFGFHLEELNGFFLEDPVLEVRAKRVVRFLTEIGRSP